MPKKTTKSIKINIKGQTEEKLLDTKVINSGSDRVSKVIVVASIIGFLVGGIVLGYLFFSKNPLNEDFAPEIIVPEEEQTIQTATTTPPGKEQAGGAKQVEILETPTGFLNVRSGPGTSFEKIGEIRPGETYELVSQDPKNGGWFEIKLDATRTGWVTKRYAEIK